MKYSNETSLIGKAANSLDIKGAIIGKTLDFIIQFINNRVNEKKWKNLFLETGEQVVKNLDDQDGFKNDLLVIFSKDNMQNIAEKSYDKRGYELISYLENEIVELFIEYGVSERNAHEYSYHFIQIILDELKQYDTDKALESYLEIWRKQSVQNYFSLKKQLDAIEIEVKKLGKDNIHVLSIEDIESDIKKSSSFEKLSLDFFEIDDEQFEMDFEDQLDNEKIIIVGKSKEESLYRILNYLKRFSKDRMILIVKDEKSWLSLIENDIRNAILVPYFNSEEILVKKDNTNIFIYNEGDIFYETNELHLRKRTIHNLLSALEKIGLDHEDARNLVNNTSGIYAFMRKHLFNRVSNFKPQWVENRSKAVIAALLCGSWTECEGDKEIISKLAEKEYDDVIQELNSYSTVEKPFVIKIDNHGSIRYMISSIEDAWMELDALIFPESWKQYISLLKEVFEELEPIFKKDFNEHYLVNVIKEKPKYSKVLKDGMLRTLIMKVIYKNNQNYQYQVDNIVKAILENIRGIEQWACISQYFIPLCEASPNSCLDRIESEFIKSTGLKELFEKNSGDIFKSNNYYVNIIFGLEQLVHIRKYVSRTINCFFRMNEFEIDYKMGNSPKNTLEVIFCPWFNSCSLNSNEKIKQAQSLIEKYKTAWNVLASQLPESHAMASSLLQPKYRIVDESEEITYGDLDNVYIEYLNLCTQYAGMDKKRWKTLIEHLDRYSIDLQKDFFNKLIKKTQSMCDNDKEYLKTKIRYIVYRHRFYNQSDWAMEEDKLMIYENTISAISFNNPIFDYRYLFIKHNMPLLHPIPYKGDDYRNKNQQLKNQLIDDKINEFIEKDYSIEDLIDILVGDDDYDIGTVFAQYYCKCKYNKEILNLLISKDSQGKQTRSFIETFYCNKAIDLRSVINDLKEMTDNTELISDIFSLQRVNGNEDAYIFTEDEQVKSIFWKRERCFFIFENASKEVIEKALAECLKYSNKENYILFLDDMKDYFSLQELYDYFIKISNLKYEGHYSVMDYPLQELLELLQKEFINDDEKCSEIAKIEWIFSGILDWDAMKCIQKEIKRNPIFYADLICCIFKDKDGNKKMGIDENIRSSLTSCFYKMKFCPSEKNGNVDYEELCKWLEDFKHLLKDQNQEYLYERLVGSLFANAPVGNDGYPPHESVRKIIEKYNSNDLNKSFIIEESNKRGVYSPDAGKSEKEIANKYYKFSKALEIDYPITANIFYELGKSYDEESLQQRMAAENE